LNIAGDLHDEIGSSLSSISVETNLLLTNSSLQESERNQLLDISDTIKDTVTAMRDIVWLINPVNKSAEEIVLKMRETASRLLAGIDWKLNIQSGTRLDIYSLEVRRNIFLIFKEALTNVARHAGATKCRIIITGNPDYTHFQINDNGIGFDKMNTRINTGMLNMKRRAALIGARFELSSVINEGTKIKLTVPNKAKILSSTFNQLNGDAMPNPNSNVNFIRKIRLLLKRKI